MINAFTVDVEEWFHVCGVPALAAPSAWAALESRVVADTQRTLDLLDRCGVRATCFVVGWVAERHPALVARIRDAGHEIGSHGQWHRRIYELDADEFTRDLRLASAAPLFGAGLGLDSIDALELVLELERSFGVVVGDEQTGGQVLRSVDAIAEFVTAQRASAGS